jgi:HPt (histidine-containing phosphotransfer) domain-containing protein
MEILAPGVDALAGDVMIDWTRLNELRDEIGEDDLADVVTLFLDEADDVVLRLSSRMSDEEMESQLHFLKGSALNLGLAGLAGLCQDGERKAEQGQGATIDLDAIKSVYEASKIAFLGALAKGSAA